MALNFNFPNNFYDLEWRVNGVWNQILTEAAQNSGHTYLNAPETRNRIPGDAYREEADLAMFQVVIAPPGGGHNNIDLHPVLQFEGKGGNSQYSWLKIRQQLFKWCVGYEADFQGTGQVDGVQRGHPIWCIGAKGDQVRFWLYSANVQQDHDLCMLPVEAINPINNVPLRIHDGTVNNLQNPPQGVGPMLWSTPAAIQIVQYMLRNPWAQGLTPLNPPNNFVPHPVGGQLGY